MTASLHQLQRALGVTRLATVTGLDRLGVEVVSAMRPAGHVLQVSTGKGLDLEQARRSALGEAAELWAAEQSESHRWVIARADELDGEVWTPDELGGATPLWSHEVRCAWVQAGHVWVPAQSVWCPPAGSASMGPSVARWTSNGLAAHPDWSRAVDHGFQEVIERHALPDTWSEDLVHACRVRAAEALVDRFTTQHFTVALFDLTPRWSPHPVAGAVLLDDERGPIPVTAGYACRPAFEDAAEAALLEAAQSRLTDIQGVREDVVSRRAQADEATLWQRWLSESKPKKPRAHRRRPLPEHVVVDLMPGALPDLQVVKVLVRGFTVSELLQ